MPKPIRDVLDDHITNVLSQLEAARAQVAMLERELADGRKARAAIESETPSALMTHNLNRVISAHALRRRQGYEIDSGRELAAYARLTMKDLVRKALEDHFVDGATANQLLDFFRNAWGRNDIVRTSLSPQLSRLKRDEVIVLRGKKWFLKGQNETLALEAPKKIEPPSGEAEGGSYGGVAERLNALDS